MDDQPGLSDQYRMSSPWPLIIVLGLVFAELGLLFNVFSVAVAGLLLFVASIAGIVQESGYAERPWNLLTGLGVVLCVLGVILTVTQLDVITAETVLAAVSESNGIVARGLAVVVAGFVALVAGAGGRFVERGSV